MTAKENYINLLINLGNYSHEKANEIWEKELKNHKNKIEKCYRILEKRRILELGICSY